MSVWRLRRSNGPGWAATMALRGPKGNRQRPRFPRDLSRDLSSALSRLREALTQVAHANDQTLASPRRLLGRSLIRVANPSKEGFRLHVKPVSSSTAG